MSSRRTSAVFYILAGVILFSVILYILAGGDAVDFMTRIPAGRSVILNVHSIQDGIPEEINGQLMQKTGFWLSYNEQSEQPYWTAYILTREMVVAGTEERSEDFRPDTTVLTGSASLADYRGSGYDRGHLVPAADMNWSHQSMSESFLMSNMSPQNPGFNRGIWRKLEEQIRKWAVQNDSLYIITGPVPGLINRTIGENKVAIPEYYFKIVLDISWPEYKGIGFIIRNEYSNRDLYDFAVSIDHIENILATDFFPGQDEEDMALIEGNMNLRKWK